MSSARAGQKKPRRSEQNLWREYAYRKEAWQEKNPKATSQEYDLMIAALVKELGL